MSWRSSFLGLLNIYYTIFLPLSIPFRHFLPCPHGVFIWQTVSFRFQPDVSLKSPCPASLGVRERIHCRRCVTLPQKRRPAPQRPTQVLKFSCAYYTKKPSLVRKKKSPLQISCRGLELVGRGTRWGEASRRAAQLVVVRLLFPPPHLRAARWSAPTGSHW